MGERVRRQGIRFSIGLSRPALSSSVQNRTARDNRVPVGADLDCNRGYLLGYTLVTDKTL